MAAETLANSTLSHSCLKYLKYSGLKMGIIFIVAASDILNFFLLIGGIKEDENFFAKLFRGMIGGVTKAK